MLQRGDLVPHFDVSTLEDEPASYSTIWQRRNLVLISLPEVPGSASEIYVARLTAQLPAFHGQNSACVITSDRVPGMPTPGALVADRWGEIVCISAAPDVAELPSPEELLDWVSYVQTQCPECEGEAR